MNQSVESPRLTLDNVKEHFDHWRKTRDKRGRIPEPLLEEVRQLAGHYSLNQISKALHMNSTQISCATSSHTGFTFVAARTQPSSQDVLGSIPDQSTNETCSIEVQRSTGDILRISHLPVFSLQGIIANFMR